MWSQQIKLAQAYEEHKNVLYTGNLTVGGTVITGDLYIPEDMIFQIEGSLTENGHGVVGAGTLRVAGNYTVDNNNGANGIDSAITVNTQVGRNTYNNLILSDDTVISARVGVNGDITGVTGYHGKLTVNGSVFANGNVNLPASDLVVNGHIEADNYHIHNGEVYSDNTLIALGDICLHNGTLTIGNAITNDRGVVHVYGDIVDEGTYVGDVTVNNGTLYLGYQSEISLNTTGGDVYVGPDGVIEQELGYINGITADDVYIYGGTVTLACTIHANTLTITAGSKVTVVGTPVITGTQTVAPGTLTILDDSGSEQPEEPSEPEVVVEIESLTFGTGADAVEVTLDDEKGTGTVTLVQGTTPGESKATGWDYKLVGDVSATVSLKDENDADVTSSTAFKNGEVYTLTVVRDTETVLTYRITVKVASNVEVTMVHGGSIPSFYDKKETIAGEPFTFSVSDNGLLEVTEVKYEVTVDTESVEETLGTTAGTYTIPGEHVLTGLTITVTTEADLGTEPPEGTTKNEVTAVIENNQVYLTVIGDVTPTDKQNAIIAAYAQTYNTPESQVKITINGDGTMTIGGGNVELANITPTEYTVTAFEIGDQAFHVNRQWNELKTASEEQSPSDPNTLRDAARFLALAQSDYVTYDFTVSATPEQGNVITVSTPNMLGDESSVPCFSDDYLHETLSTQNGHENSTEFIILAIDKDGETLFKLLSNNNTTNRTVEINSETYTINVVGWN